LPEVGADAERTGVEEIAFEAYGVRVRVRAETPEVIERLAALLPPGAEPCPSETAETAMGVLTDTGGTYQFLANDRQVSRHVELPLALHLLENELRTYVGLHAPSRIFVHAGVVALDDRALVLPGRSFSGKTRIVLELVRLGATYYSDEYAVIDPDGLVHPYAKSLSLRDQNQVQQDHHIAGLGGNAGDRALPVAAVVSTIFRPGAGWQPEQLTVGKGVLAMMLHTLAARSRADEALPALRRAVEGAVLLEGDRGEAADVAPKLLELLTDHQSIAAS
jgi:hypothetical protein